MASRHTRGAQDPSSRSPHDEQPRRKRNGARGIPREAREELILEVAGRVLARAGYHASSMDEIAELAQVSKPMLYAYFGSKEGLYVAYIERTGRELLDRLVGAAPREVEPIVRLRRRIAEFFSFVEEHRDGWTVLFTEATSIAPVAAEVTEVRSQIADAVQRMVLEAVGDDSGRRPTTADALAHAIVGAGESLANWWLENPQVGLDEVADLYLAVVRGAVTTAMQTDALKGGDQAPDGSA